MAPRRGLLVIILLFLFLTHLVFFDTTTRSFAQGPYPSATPDTSCIGNGGTCYSLSYICSDHGQSFAPGLVCGASQKCCTGIPPTPTVLLPSPIGGYCSSGGGQGLECDQTSDCKLSGCPPTAGSVSCLGVNNPIQSAGDCGRCYCTDPNPTAGTCGSWEGCGYEDPPGAWCETRRCDNGCTCSDTNPACCTYQIQCPCAVPTSVGGTGVPSNTPTRTPTPSNTPPNTPTVTPGCSQLYRCRTSDYTCPLTAETFNNNTMMNCPGNTYSCADAYNACYQTLGGCQAACATPTPTPSNTATPGPSLTLTPTLPSMPLFCNITGNKYIVDIAGPVGLCDEPSEMCSPATGDEVALDDMIPAPPSLIGSQTSNPYAFINIAADSTAQAYRVTPDGEAPFR